LTLEQSSCSSLSIIIKGAKAECLVTLDHPTHSTCRRLYCSFDCPIKVVDECGQQVRTVFSLLRLRLITTDLCVEFPLNPPKFAIRRGVTAEKSFVCI
jgi:hypothetical protein